MPSRMEGIGSVRSFAAMYPMTTGSAMNGSSSVANERTTMRKGNPPPGMRPETSAMGIMMTNAIIGPGWNSWFAPSSAAPKKALSTVVE